MTPASPVGLATGALALAFAYTTGTPAEPSAADLAVERFLLDATIVEDVPLERGVTRSRRWTLEWGGERRRAVYKTVDVHVAGELRDDNLGYMQNFSDSFKYDRAAYLLDRRLGLGRVPVVVLRSKDGVPGAVIEWIEDAVDEVARNAGQGPKISPQSFQLQQSMMKLFDSLIRNDDRNIGNQLWTEDGTMRWIDHTRAFRLTRKMQKPFADAPAQLTPRVHEELKSLEFGELAAMLGDLMSKKRIKALLARRDRILAKIDADLDAYGERAVYAEELAE